MNDMMKGLREFGKSLSPWGSYLDIQERSVADLFNAIPVGRFVQVEDVTISCEHCRPVLKQLLADLGDGSLSDDVAAYLTRAIEVLNFAHANPLTTPHDIY